MTESRPMFRPEERTLDPEACSQLNAVNDLHIESDIHRQEIEGPNENDRFKLLKDHGELMEIERTDITDEMKR